MHSLHETFILTFVVFFFDIILHSSQKANKNIHQFWHTQSAIILSASHTQTLIESLRDLLFSARNTSLLHATIKVQINGFPVGIYFARKQNSSFNAWMMRPRNGVNDVLNMSIKKNRQNIIVIADAMWIKDSSSQHGRRYINASKGTKIPTVFGRYWMEFFWQAHICICITYHKMARLRRRRTFFAIIVGMNCSRMLNKGSHSCRIDFEKETRETFVH